MSRLSPCLRNHPLMWLYIPVCIRLSDLDRVSGIHVVKIVESFVSESFCLTVCHLPLPLPRILVAAPQLHHDIVWHDALVAASAPVFLPSDPLYLYLCDALAHGFNLFPLDAGAGASLHQIQVVKLQCGGLYNSETAWAFSPLELGSTAVPAPLTIRSTPFSFSVPVAFADFLSSGHINCVLRDSAISGYLSDVKYLENMAGGIANSEGRSIGLVIGNLRKKNGDGDLVVVCLLRQLWHRLRASNKDTPLPPLQTHVITTIDSLSTVSVPAPSSFSDLTGASPSTTPGPVLPVTISLNAGDSWGSCVLVDENTIVTNQHVLQPWLDSQNGVCSILLPDRTLTLGRDDEVVIPYNNLDLAFVRISPQNQAFLTHVKTATINREDIAKGDVVRTVGYGLFLNKEHLEPLTSEGIVSAIVHARPFSNADKMPCMIVASGLCWNGSSGGGLFDTNGNLAGILCSNAQVFVPSVGDDKKTEKIPQFALCIPTELVSACYERKLGRKNTEDSTSLLLLEVEHTWQLKSTHRDTYERNVKL